MRIKLICFLFLMVVSSCSVSSDAQNTPELKDATRGYDGPYHGKVLYEIADSKEKITFENVSKAKISKVWLEFPDGLGKVSLSKVAIKKINELYRHYIRFCLTERLENSVSAERDKKITEDIDKLDEFLLGEKILSPDGERLLSDKERGRITGFVIKKALERCNSD